MNTLNDWFEEVERKVLDENQRVATKQYIQNLLSQGLPVIFDLRHLSLLVGIRKWVVQSIIFRSSKFYYYAEIPKRKGGVRKLTIPFPVLKVIQQWIVEEILRKLPIHEAATAFFTKCSIKTNVEPHCDNPKLLSIDIKDFFPSIHIERVIAFFIYLGYHPKVAFFLGRICCENNTLPQGAPTSPYLSNLILKRLDKRVSKLSEINQLVYTRYADDLSFSGTEIPSDFLGKLNDILNSEGFVINPEKIKKYKKGGPKIITGISIATNIPKLPKSVKRRLRQEVYYINKFGTLSHLEKIQCLDAIYVDRIKGRLNFWKFVEPQSAYPREALKKLTT